MDKKENIVYHFCIQENKLPCAYPYHNKFLQEKGALVSLEWRRGPIFKEDCYLVFWYEGSNMYFSRVNPVLHGLDAFFFKDGHEMFECRNWEECLEKIQQFNEKGYCYEEV